MRILSLHFPRMDIHRQVRQQIIQVFRCLRCRAGSSVSFLREDQVYSWEDVPTMCFVESHMHTAFSFMQMMLTGKKRARNIIKASLLENWRNVIRSEMNTMRSLPESAETIPIITIW